MSVPVRGSVQSSSSAVLHSALHNGLGIGPVGEAYLGERGRAAGLVPVLPDWTFENNRLYAVYPVARKRDPVIEAFLEEARVGLRSWF